MNQTECEIVLGSIRKGTGDAERQALKIAMSDDSHSDKIKALVKLIDNIYYDITGKLWSDLQNIDYTKEDEVLDSFKYEKEKD